MWCKNKHSLANVQLTRLQGPKGEKHAKVETSKLKQALDSLDDKGNLSLPSLGRAPAAPQAPEAAAQGHWCRSKVTSKLRSAMTSLVHPSDSLYGGHWKAKAFPLSPQSLLNASAQHGYAGALLRQQKVAAKLLLGEPVRIAVMGGSMTAGTNCSTSWPRRLGELLVEMGYNVAVENLAHGGATSEHAVHHVHFWMSELEQVDMVIIDYSINDDSATKYNEGGGTMNGPGAVRESFKDLVALLSALPSKPAVLATLSSHSDPAFCRDHRGSKCGSCETDVDEFLHWKAAKDLQIPVMYYPAAVCASGSLHWLDLAGEPLLGNHPAEVTHDLFARAVAGSLLLQAEDVCEQGFTGADLPPMRVNPETLCVTEKPLTYVHGLEENEDAFRPLAHDENWFFKSGDSKTGWHTNDNRTGEIVFAIDTRVGWVHLEFMGGGRFGFADVYLDSDRRTPCRVTAGETAVQNSQSMYETIQIKAAGSHTLHIRNHGMFRLTGLYAC